MTRLTPRHTPIGTGYGRACALALADRMKPVIVVLNVLPVSTMRFDVPNPALSKASVSKRRNCGRTVTMDPYRYFRFLTLVLA